jgi:hypothetical protein
VLRHKVIDLDAGKDQKGIVGVEDNLCDPGPVPDRTGLVLGADDGPTIDEAQRDVRLHRHLQIGPAAPAVVRSEQTRRLGAGEDDRRVPGREGDGGDQSPIHGRGHVRPGTERGIQSI